MCVFATTIGALHLLQILNGMVDHLVDEFLHTDNFQTRAASLLQFPGKACQIGPDVNSRIKGDADYVKALQEIAACRVQKKPVGPQSYLLCNAGFTSRSHKCFYLRMQKRFTAKEAKDTDVKMSTQRSHIGGESFWVGKMFREVR
jgi:hypothetical protein